MHKTQTTSGGIHTVCIENRDAGYATMNELVDDIYNRRLDACCLKICECTDVQVPQWFAQKPGLSDVDCDEFENAILREDADDHGSFCVVIDVDERKTTGPGGYHSTACFV